jgi:hypothetical protein
MGGEYFQMAWVCFKIFFHELLSGMIKVSQLSNFAGLLKGILRMPNNMISTT